MAAKKQKNKEPELEEPGAPEMEGFPEELAERVVGTCRKAVAILLASAVPGPPFGMRHWAQLEIAKHGRLGPDTVQQALDVLDAASDYLNNR